MSNEDDATILINLKTFMCAIQNFFFSWMENGEIEGQISILEKGKIYEQEKERKRKERETAEDPELTFKPKINTTHKKAKKAIEDGEKANP